MKRNKPYPRGGQRRSTTVPQYVPPREDDWLLAVPQSVVGADAKTFSPYGQGWVAYTGGDPDSWGRGRLYAWSLPGGMPRVYLKSGSPGYFGMDQLGELLPQDGDTYVVFTAKAGCDRGDRCSQRRIIISDNRSEVGVHTAGYCPMALLGDHIWRRAGQIKR